MKKKYFCLFFVLISICIFGQTAVDVFDPFYKDLKTWENMGIINDAPMLRPLPLQEIERILNIVKEEGDEGQQKIAQNHYNRLFLRVFHFGGKTELNLKSPEKNLEYIFAPLIEMNYKIAKYFTASATVSAYLTNKMPDQSPLPRFQYSKHDLAQDSVYLGSMYLLPVFNSGIAIGSPEYYLTIGIARTNYGPFPNNNILVGSQAMHQGQFNFVVNKPKWTYCQSLLALTATNDKRENRGPNKFLTIHSFDYRPLPWLSFGLVDSIVYGNRFDPIYLIPFSAYFISEGLFGFPDNSLIGGMFTIKPIKGMRLDGLLYTDDIGFNEIVKFKKDAKCRMSGQFGISYTMPKTHWFKLVDFNYTFVLPYTYTHVESYNIEAKNYQNYTHNGRSLGSNLPHNSDRFYIETEFVPLQGLSVFLKNAFIRHANVNEGLDDLLILRDYFAKEYTTDGSVFNHATITRKNSVGETSNIDHAYLYSTPFLKQETIEYINQLELGVNLNMPILKSGGSMQFEIKYLFEADINPGANQNMYKKNQACEAWINKSVDSIGAEKIIAERNRQLSEWKKLARGKQFNHYFSISAKVSY